MPSSFQDQLLLDFHVQIELVLAERGDSLILDVEDTTCLIFV